MQKSTRKLNTNKIGHRIAFFEAENEVYFVSCRKSPKTFNILPRSTSFASSSPILKTINRFFCWTNEAHLYARSFSAFISPSNCCSLSRFNSVVLFTSTCSFSFCRCKAFVDPWSLVKLPLKLSVNFSTPGITSG